MLPAEFYEPLRQTEQYRTYKNACARDERIAAFGVSDGMKAYLVSALCGDLERPIVLISTNDQHAMRLYDDIYALIGDAAAYLPARETVLYHVAAESREITARRLTTLGRALAGGARVVVMPVEALLCPLTPADMFRRYIMTFTLGERLDLEKTLYALAEAGYEREDMVEGRGQFAMRGGILDIFPINALSAVRIEFFDDEIDTIREFDVLTQRSLNNRADVTVYPASEALADDACFERGARRARNELDRLLEAMGESAAPAPLPEEGADEGDILPSLWEMDAPRERPRPSVAERLRERIERIAHGERFEGLASFLPYLYEGVTTALDYCGGALVLLDEPAHMKERADNVLLEFAEQLRGALERFDALPGHGALLLDWGTAAARMLSGGAAAMQSLETGTADFLYSGAVRFDTRGVGTYHSQTDMLLGDLRKLMAQNRRIVLMTGGSARGERLAETLRDRGVECSVSITGRTFQPGRVIVLPDSYTRGFDSPDAGITVLADADIFGVTKRRGARSRRSAGQRIEAFTDLKPGDAVVHESHGVGVYVGTVRLEVEGLYRDYLHIRYQGTDKLYVPVDQLDRVQKYIGSDEGSPKLNRLGGGDWARAKQRAKQSIAAMAHDLVKLYAERQASKGTAFSNDTPWQREFEDNFPYEETPDQLQCIMEIKRDMERSQVMDRLLCGDVGYGKTEVAVRAAFKAVMDSKQVAFLVPTTILAQQHYQTLKKRFDGFPVRAEVLSRFRTPAEQKKVLAQLRSGEVDVVVGTHRLLGKDIRFKDLGLLVVDEEQRFGVSHKEHIKALRKNVDVLTMSATPIPRTLHMSMVGIRDMSLIETPPEERYPVQTYVIEYNESMVRDAILRELARGGQVYFVYNRVEFIDQFHEKMRALVPEARIAVAHGQMRENALEDVMMDFYEGRQDVLLCSTIIESGLDIPSVNTMIVYDADRFGLSQLYQLRGRVGRSNRLAYCYLTVRRDKVLSETADKRLSAIREFTDFGAGFKIAMRDLEIRGAGNILGAEQHGHLSAVGYDMYVKLMEQTMREMRGEQAAPDIETIIDLKLDAYLPKEYVRGEGVRIEVYKHIASIENRDDFEDMKRELVDRFGDFGLPVTNLLYIALLKALCSKLYIEQAYMRGHQIMLRFSERAALEPLRLMDGLSKIGNRLMLVSGPPPQLAFKENMPAERAVVEVCALLEQLVKEVLAVGAEG